MKYFVAILILVISVSMPAFANTTAKKLLIVEVMTGNNASASAEYIEIYNPNNSIVDIEDYKVEYKSAAGSDWTAKSGLKGKVGPRGRYLLVTTQLGVTGSATVSSGMAATGGHVRISKDGAVLDVLGWGNADYPEVLAAPTHAKEQSIKRLVDEDGNFMDTNDNSKDFFLSLKPSPSFNTHTESAPAATSSTSKPSTLSSSSSGSGQTANRSSYPIIELSELFIDPESPLTDKEDEFIEIYNPNDKAVDLTKYKIQTGGTSWRYSYEFEAKTIAPKSYLSVYSEESGLTLSNSGAQARILDPNGKVLDGVSYEKAKAGLSLVKVNGKWGWSEDPSPENANNISGAGDSDGASAEDSGFEKVAGATTEKDKDKDDEKSGFQTEDEEKSTIDTSVLVIVGGLAILYGLYEYRQDIRGAFTKLKRYFTNRRKSRSAA